MVALDARRVIIREAPSLQLRAFDVLTGQPLSPAGAWYRDAVAVHVIGLTGGIASGKSTVAAMLAERGAAVVDADLLARHMVEPGQPALAELVARFGVAILTSAGTLDRKRLGSLAFADAAARADLQRITHPRIAAASAAAIAAWADAGANIVFYEAALLVENRAHLGLAGLVVVAAMPEVQHARIMARDQLGAAEASARITAQAPLADKLAAATWVIQNDGERTHLVAAVAQVVAEIEASYGPIRVPDPVRGTRAKRSTGAGPPVGQVALVTGFPAFTARRMLAQLAQAEPTTRLFVLAQERAAPAAAEFVTSLGVDTEILVGDVCDMDLGLSSVEYRALSKELTWIHHLATTHWRGTDPKVARALNVGGTRSVLDLARDCARLARLVHWSSALVSGDRHGTVYEADLEAGQKFHDAYERTKYAAELLVRAAMRDLPIAVVRPGVIVGDSQTGEIDHVRAPGSISAQLARLATNPRGVAFPRIGRGDAPLHLVPIDYVVAAAWQVARAEQAAGQTFHLVDPAPLPSRVIFDRVAALAGTEPPRGYVPRSLARALQRAPGLGRWRAQSLALADVPDHVVHYDQTNTARALAGTPLRCPPLLDYLPALVGYLRAKQPSHASTISDDAPDPLA